MKPAILTINYNAARFLQKQTELYKKFINGDCDFYVGDNSRDKYQRKCNYRIASDAHINYLPLSIKEGDNSRHHGLALNKCLQHLSKYDQILILDHDCFPFKPSNIFEKYSDYDFAGIHQKKEDTVYLAPIFLLINNFNKNKYPVDFFPTPSLDTGGAMRELIKNYKVRYVNEQLSTHEGFEYAIVDDGFIHFTKGSGWDGNPRHELRINKLFEKLQALIELNTTFVL